MHIEQKYKITVVTADDGCVLKSNDNFIATQFWLGCNDSPDNYEEVLVSEIETETENESEEL